MRRALRILTWDGLLPVIVAFVPIVTRLFFPRGHIAEVVVVIVMPISLALVRSQTGFRELSELCGEYVALWRQILFGIAIALLLAFEVLVTMLIFAKDEPDSAWVAPAVLLIAYMASVWFSLRPNEPTHASGQF